MKYLFTLMLLAAGSLSALVEDRAQLFSKAAAQTADKKLGEVKTSTGKEVLVLTTPDLGGQTISQFIRKEAMDRKLNGVIIVISVNPRQLEVVPGRKTALVFNRDKAQQTMKIFQQNLRKNPDKALGEAVQLIYETFKNAPAAMLVADSHQIQPAAPATEPSSGGGWLKWLIIAVVVFGVIRLIGFLLSRNQAAAAPGSATAAPGAFGGGFMSSLLGGLFGAMAGHWLYDKFFSDHEDRSYHATDSRPDDNDWRGDDHGDLGSGSGGDWGGDDSSGGDSGGGDW